MDRGRPGPISAQKKTGRSFMRRPVANPQRRLSNDFAFFFDLADALARLPALPVGGFFIVAMAFHVADDPFALTKALEAL